MAKYLVQPGQFINYEPPNQEDKWREWAAGEIIDTTKVPKGEPPLNVKRLLEIGAIEEVSRG